jgi:prepilin signal peptidase PulO-like enzyme (type II secretory pathway)
VDLFLFLSLFVFGLIFGSFLNVVTIRYNPDKGFSNMRSLGGRSRCPICRKQLAWYELVPVFSFLFLRGKCRHCGHRISLQYPIVELLTALIFAVVPLQVASYAKVSMWTNLAADPGLFVLFSALWICVFVLLLVLAVIDCKHMIIPDSINVALGFAGVALAGLTQSVHGFGALQGSFIRHYAMIFGLRESIWANHLVAALVGLVFFGSIILLSRGRAMGWGDFKLVGALGLVFGWPDIVLVMMFSFVVGSVISLGLMARGRKTMKDAVPFGPFLVVGSACVFFFGFQFMSLYFGLFAL